MGGCSLYVLVSRNGEPWFVGMSQLNSDAIDSCARELGSKRLRLELPWEQQPLKSFFSNLEPNLQVVQPPDWIDYPVSAAATSIKSGVSDEKHFGFKHARMRLSQISWSGSEKKKLHFALQCWKVIILGSTVHTSLGRKLLDCSEAELPEDDIFDILHDVFARKATNTLNARAASLLAFGRWKRCISGSDSCGVFPISEELAYRYLCDLRRNNAAASKRKRFLEAVGFSEGLLGADVDEVLQSARISGVAHGGFVEKRGKKQPFTTEQVITLENMATFSSGPVAIFAGYLCFLVHCRLRWSDGQHCVNEPHLDITDGRGFVEASLYHHKTAMKRRAQVVRLLPVAGVLPGLSGQMWAVHWILKRRQAGLNASLLQPTMPSPVIGGGWNKLPLSSSEASVWLREILNPWYAGDLSELATHSAKATILSWMAKANVSVSMRRLAGYHMKPGDKSALEYSRDAAAPILREIEGILIAVKAGYFKPDEVRSRRWWGCDSIQEAIKLSAEFGRRFTMGQPTQGDEQQTAVGSETFLGDDLSKEFREHEENFLEGLCAEPAATTDCQDMDESIHDDFPLARLRPQTSSVNPDFVNDVESSDVDPLSSSDDTSLDSESVSTDRERRATIDGEVNARGLVPPSDLAGRACYMNKKSCKLHLVRSESQGVSTFFCGRKAGPNYMLLDETPVFDGNGCIVCFNYSSGHANDSDSS